MIKDKNRFSKKRKTMTANEQDDNEMIKMGDNKNNISAINIGEEQDDGENKEIGEFLDQIKEKNKD